MNSRTKKITLSAMMAAMVFVATFFLKVPLPQGYAHIGNCFVLLSGWILGPVYGALAAGIGSVLADVCGGFAVYIIPTFIIKALSAALAYFGIHLAGNIVKSKLPKRILGGIFGGWICPIGYFVFEIFIYGYAAALLDIWGLIAEECIGIACAVLLASAIDKTPVKIK